MQIAFRAKEGGVFLFDVTGNQITLTSGDTGILSIVPEPSGRIPAPGDAAVFTVKDRVGGRTFIRKILSPDEAGVVTIVLSNADTEGMQSGVYVWDIRYVVSPVYDGKGSVTDGEEVSTPFPYAPFIVLEAVSFI